MNSCNQLKNKGFNNLGQSIKLLSSLESLRLDFEYCSITHEAANALSENLEQLPNLQSFDFNHIQCEMDEEDDNVDEVEEEDDDLITE